MNVYCGKRSRSLSHEVTVYRNGKKVSTRGSLKWRGYGSERLDWGYRSDASLQLAFLLLLDVTGSIKAAEQWHHAFCSQVICELRDQWVMTSEEIARWHAEARPDPTAQPREEKFDAARC